MNPFFAPTKILDSLILMQIIREGPLHGYALAVSINENIGWKPSQTAVYNSLKSMENEGLVSAEEKIESGRVQRIYSITEKGRESFKETKEKMKVDMRRNFNQLLSFAQVIGETEQSEYSEKLQLIAQEISEKLRHIYFISLLSLRKAPEEAEAIINEATEAFDKLAEKHGITLQEEDASGKIES